MVLYVEKGDNCLTSTLIIHLCAHPFLTPRVFDLIFKRNGNHLQD